MIEYTRSGIVESQHRAHVCVADSSGELLMSIGNPGYVTFMRSSAKPLQAIAVVTTGTADKLRLDERELAVISGSHGGETCHLDAVKSILAKAGLDSSYLQCGSHPPLDAGARKALEEAGREAEALHHNCSGKHAGMLATAVSLGEPLAGYLDPTSAVQRRITAIISELAGVGIDDIVIGIDGCAAPVHGLAMKAAAAAFARMIDPTGIEPETASASQCIVRAMRAYPEMVASNQGRICTALIRSGLNHGLIAKSGAEGYYAAAWRDPDSRRGIGMALKIEDGTQRARDPLIIALLQKFRVLPAELDEKITPFAARPIRNFRGDVVGDVNIRI